MDRKREGRTPELIGWELVEKGAGEVGRKDETKKKTCNVRKEAAITNSEKRREKKQRKQNKR